MPPMTNFPLLNRILLALLAASDLGVVILCVGGIVFALGNLSWPLAAVSIAAFAVLMSTRSVWVAWIIGGLWATGAIILFIGWAPWLASWFLPLWATVVIVTVLAWIPGVRTGGRPLHKFMTNRWQR